MPASPSGASPVGANSSSLQLRDRVLDRLLALGRVEALARRRREDEVEDATLLLDELGLDQVGGPLRVGARDLELVLEAASDGEDEDDERDDDADPREHDPPRMRGARPHPARQRPGREALVRGKAIRPGLVGRRLDLDSPISFALVLCHGYSPSLGGSPL